MTDMLKRRILSVVVAVLAMMTVASAQSVTYLSSRKPVASHAYDIASQMYPQSFDPTYSHSMELGGVRYKNGFALSVTYGPTRPGYAEFDLQGRYSMLTFILGGSPYHSAGSQKGVFAITADGKKLMDKAVTPYDVPERISLDVAGVRMLRFEIVTGDISVGIAEPVLWIAAQKPRAIGKTDVAPARPVRLVSELRPYRIDNSHRCVSTADGDLKTTHISGKTYDSGLEMNADMPLSGKGEAWTYFNLGGKYSRLRFIAGPKDSDSGTLGVAWLTVKTDGKIIYEYEVTGGSTAKEISLDITGCRQLSIESENESGSITIALGDIMAYPAGTEPTLSSGQPGHPVADASLKKLPDVCKLVSNIPPYAVGGSSQDRANTVFDGKSEHITFSMGGVRFNEGVILQSSSNIFNDNTRAHAIFNLGGEFDYVSFTAGWVSKCGVLKNDTLRVYTDDKVALEVPLIATSPNQKYIVSLNRCESLKFEKRGFTSMSHPVFGIADAVLYRGEPKDNDLFTHPIPQLPDNADLIALGAPYIHYVSPMKDHKDQIFYDGSTLKRYFRLGDERINEGFMLQTSVHFDLESGALGGEGGGTAAVAGAMGAAPMVGAVGGATISAVFPFGALIALAAGGTAMESSCAAFNTYNAYDELTFTVACVDRGLTAKGQKERLLVGGDGKVLREFVLDADMQPTTFTVPLNHCGQLMFWLQCGENTSAQYIFYDLRLRK